MERYLAWFPFLFLCLAYFLTFSRTRTALAFSALCVLFVWSNAWQLSTGRVHGILDADTSRISVLTANTKPDDLVYLLNNQDGLFLASNTMPFEMNVRRLPVLVGIRPVLGLAGNWRKRFSADVLSAWRNDRDVWITARVWSSRPKPEWNWAEGADPGISWEEIQMLFDQLDLAPVIGGSDGFALLRRTGKNQSLLAAIGR